VMLFPVPIQIFVLLKFTKIEHPKVFVGVVINLYSGFEWLAIRIE